MSHISSRPSSRPTSKIMGHTRQQSSQKLNIASLKAATMIESKPRFSAEIMAKIIDYLPVADLMRCARVSKRLREMAYDDTRWVQKLQLMGLWNESEARQRDQQAPRRPGDSSFPNSPLDRRKPPPLPKAQPTRPPLTSSATLFDASWEQQRPTGQAQKNVNGGVTSFEKKNPLSALRDVQSSRGQARRQYGLIYGALAPLYFDISTSSTYADLRVFREYKEPEDQAQMLSQLRTFSRSDTTLGWSTRESQLSSVMHIFESAAMREFEQGLFRRDLGGSMKRFAQVLITVNGGDTLIHLFINKNWLLNTQPGRIGNPMDCLKTVVSSDVNLLPARDFFETILNALNDESRSIERVFPSSADVMPLLFERVTEKLVTPYITALFDEAHRRGSENFVRIVPGVFEQAATLVGSLKPPNGSSSDFQRRLTEILQRVFEPHIDLYLRDELDYFKLQANNRVEAWQKQLSEAQASAESFFMSNVHRQAAKKDFLSSFKKVLMAPVNALPTWSSESKSHDRTMSNGDSNSRSSTPDMALDGFEKSTRPMNFQKQAPMTELEAKAAIMNSKLEGIGSLFSIEVAITVIQAAKASIERLARFVKLGGTIGSDAKAECEAVFVEVLQILGWKHIKPGFDLALDSLSSYSARDATEHGQSGVKPLVTFLELVNIGDLMQQMVDVFYMQELVTPKLSDPDDFLSATVKEKKRFEQMLDDRVAAGLNKGIDALMDEVEFICATTQSPADYNPEASSEAKGGVFDIGTTKTARQVVTLVSQHTDMLVGSTDKNTLDVFNQEVGLRLHSALCKHIKRQRISVNGAVNLISDTNHYFEFVKQFKNKELLQYYTALRNVAQIFLIDGKRGKEIGELMADGERYQGTLRTEEVIEFAERRADWYSIRSTVEKAMYGACVVM